MRQADISSWRDAVAYMLEELTVYNDGGTNYPNVYIVLGKRIKKQNEELAREEAEEEELKQEMLARKKAKAAKK